MEPWYEGTELDRVWATTMQDMMAHLEKLRRYAAECQLIGDLACGPEKRHLFARLADHYRMLASEVEKAIAEKQGNDT
jgi:hypothetical protein